MGANEYPNPTAAVVLGTIKSRRAVRKFTDEPVSTEHLRMIIEAARWASSAGNRRIHKFYVTQDPSTIRLIRLMSPGMQGIPTALIIVCTDTEAAEEKMVNLEDDKTTWIDVGTAAMNMQVAAHAIGLGSCVVTSFSTAGIAAILDFPPRLVPELMLMVGHPAATQHGAASPPGRSKRLTVDDLTYWEKVPTA